MNPKEIQSPMFTKKKNKKTLLKAGIEVQSITVSISTKQSGEITSEFMAWLKDFEKAWTTEMGSFLADRFLDDLKAHIENEV